MAVAASSTTASVVLGGRQSPAQGKFSMNPMRKKDDTGERLGKGFLFLMAQSPFSMVLSGSVLLSYATKLALSVPCGHSTCMLPLPTSSRKNSMGGSLGDWWVPALLYTRNGV